MINFLKRHKKTTKILLTLLIFLLISVFSMVLLYLFNVIDFNFSNSNANADGSSNVNNDSFIIINKELFNSFKHTWYGYIIVMLAQVVITSLLSFVPGSSMACIMLVKSLYNNPIVSFAVSFAGVLFTSFMLYTLGRFGGYALGKKIIGEEDCEKASQLLNSKGLIYFPVMMMFPVFPDDALTMVAGTLKMSLKWFIPSIIIGRGIGVFTIIFGLSLFDFSNFEW